MHTKSCSSPRPPPRITASLTPWHNVWCEGARRETLAQISNKPCLCTFMSDSGWIRTASTLERKYTSSLSCCTQRVPGSEASLGRLEAEILRSACGLRSG
jgi:hypothetical protein